LNSAINYLLSIESRGIKLGLERTQFIMKSCGNPHANLPVIQVAGTNGKGSVCAILEKIFRDSGYKTGLFTSPHLVNVNERIRINGKPIENKKIESFINQYKHIIENNDITFFECMTAISAWYFKKQNVDVAIMETGLGGKFDSVSICTPIATIITPISYDHMEILGKTLKDIAIQKAGIMKKNILCISAKQKPTVEKTLKIEAKNANVPLYFLDNNEEFDFDFNIPGNKQKENAKLALFLIKYLNKFDFNKIFIENALKSVKWYGRNQILQVKPTIIFDVGHNESGIRSFIQYYKTLQILGDSTLIISLYSRKNIIKLIPLLEAMFINVICTETGGKNPMPASILANHFTPSHNIKIIPNPNSAIGYGIKKLKIKDGMVILGTHCFGPAISKIFNISFDNL